MTCYPKLKFVINKKRELKTFSIFLNESKYRYNNREMNWAFYKYHPKLNILRGKKLNPLEKTLIVKQYLNAYYQKNLVTIKRGTSKAQKDWQKKEDFFFNLVNKIFKNYPWPKGKYIAYSTIWGMYPRFLNEKTFQFPYHHKKKNFVSVVIAHEMIHFIFYDYFYKHFPKFKNPKYNLEIWNISEAFNILIQNSKEWVKVFNQKAIPYPEHQILIRRMKKFFDKKQDINYLLKRIIPTV